MLTFTEHWRACSKLKEPCFDIYQFLYEEKKYFWEFNEKRYVINLEPQINSYQQISSTHEHRFNHLKDLLCFLCTVIKGNKKTVKYSTYINLL